MLKLNQTGSFNILVIADVQDCRPLDENKQEHLSRLIHSTTPDLIVLLGDMLFGPLVWTRRKADAIISSILAPIEAGKIPFAVVSGNHDQDARIPFSKQVDMYRKSPLCLTPGIGNRKCPDAYSLDVSDGNNAAIARLLFLDSGATRLSLSGIKYLPASREQLDYTQTLLSASHCPPVFIFQHIPVPEICQLTKVVPAGTASAVCGRCSGRREALILKDPDAGTLGEFPCPAWDNTDQFQGWEQSRRVCAAVFGHDHKNSFSGTVNDISLIQVSCAGLSCYGTDTLRGGQLLTIYPGNKWETEALYYPEIM